MTRPLSRRALFALPVALPVAALAAKVEAVAEAPLVIDVDLGSLHDRYVVWTATGMRRGKSVAIEAFARSARREGVRFIEMHPGERAREAAKRVTAQAAAPVGDTTSRSQEGDASDSVAPREMAEPVAPPGNEGTSGERDTVAQPVVA